MSNISENIRIFRKSRNMTQGQLAQRVGITASAVSMYERGEREPDIDTIEALADVFNVPLASLFQSDQMKAPVDSSISLQSPDELELILAFRALNDTGRAALLTSARAFSDNPAFARPTSKDTAS